MTKPNLIAERLEAAHEHSTYMLDAIRGAHAEACQTGGLAEVLLLDTIDTAATLTNRLKNLTTSAARDAAGTVGKTAPPRDHLRELRDMARDVINNWETGNLAEAVNELRLCTEEIEREVFPELVEAKADDTD